jgi:hypothetical protein
MAISKAQEHGNLTTVSYPEDQQGAALALNLENVQLTLTLVSKARWSRDHQLAKGAGTKQASKTFLPLLHLELATQKKVLLLLVAVLCFPFLLHNRHPLAIIDTLYASFRFLLSAATAALH